MKLLLSRATRAAVCAAFCVTLALAPLAQDSGRAQAQAPAQTPAQQLAATVASLPFKSVEQLRAEAATYDKAVAELASLANAPLDTVDQMKVAVALVERDRPALKLFPSKFAAVALEDKTFRDAVLKKLTDEKTARAFGKALAADPKVVMSLDGALALQARFVAQTKTDDKALHAAAAAMKKAADKQTAASGKKDNGSTAAVVDDSGALNAVALSAEIIELSPLVLGVVSILCPPLGIALTLGSAGILVGAYAIFVAAAVTGLTALVSVVVTNFLKNVGTDSGRDATSQCLKHADDVLQACYKTDNNFFPVLPVIVDMACDAQWTSQAGLCLVQ